jgi:hypothetical protein
MIIGNMMIGIGSGTSSGSTVQGVANFITTSSSNGLASVRNTDYEVTSTNKPMSWSIWIKGDNLGKLTECIFSASDTTREQYALFWLGEDGTTSNCRKLNFIVYGASNGSILKQIVSANRLLRNRWNHIVITEAGTTGASGANGINLYVNGVLDTVVRSNTGTFANAYSTANMRIRLGGSQRTGATSYYGGQVGGFGFYNRVLTAGEALTLYNGGSPMDETTASFYATAGIDFFTCKTTLTSVESFALTENSVTFVNSNVSSAVESISFKKAQDTNTQYVAFGNIIPMGGTAYAWYGRTGTAHIPNGNVYKSLIDISTFSSAPTNTTPVTEVSTQHVSGVSAGVIGSDIYLLYSRFNDSTSLFVSSGWRKSSDGMTGAAFGSYTTIPTTYPRYEHYNKIVSGFTAGEYFVPRFQHNNDVEWRVEVLRTTDSGTSWTPITVVESLTKLGEPAIINTGTQLLILSRNNAGGLWQITSAVGDGTTWNSPADTNLGTGISNGDMCLTDSGKINVVFMDRNDRFLWLSRDNEIATVTASPTSWATPEKLARSYGTDSENIIGYPTILNTGGGKFLVTYSPEFSSSRCDLYWGYGDFSTLGG